VCVPYTFRRGNLIRKKKGGGNWRIKKERGSLEKEIYVVARPHAGGEEGGRDHGFSARLKKGPLIQAGGNAFADAQQINLEKGKEGKNCLRRRILVLADGKGYEREGWKNL